MKCSRANHHTTVSIRDVLPVKRVSAAASSSPPPVHRTHRQGAWKRSRSVRRRCADVHAMSMKDWQSSSPAEMGRIVRKVFWRLLESNVKKEKERKKEKRKKEKKKKRKEKKRKEKERKMNNELTKRNNFEVKLATK